MSHAIIRTDLMHGTYNAADLLTVRYQVSETDTAIDNGNVVVVGGLMTGEREIRIGTTPTASSAKSDIAIIATPPVTYEVGKTEADFFNEAGVNARAYRLVSGDKFSVTMEAIGGRAKLSDVVVGDTVELAASTKLNVVASATESSTVIGKVIAKEGDYVVIEVA